MQLICCKNVQKTQTLTVKTSGNFQKGAIGVVL